MWIPLTLLAVGVLRSSWAGAEDGEKTKSAPLRLTDSIPLAELKGGFNHLAADAKRQLFYVTAPGEKKVAVVDLKAKKMSRVLTDVPASAAKYLPDFDVLCLSGGGGVTFLKGDSLTPFDKVDLGSAVDELQYDVRHQRLYAGVMDAATPGIAVIDVRSRKVTETFNLPAKPQGFVVEEHGARIYVNTPAARQVTVIDREKHAVVAEWKLDEAQSNYPIALDETNHRLFVGCRRPPILLVLDTATGKMIAKVDTGGDADDMSFDAANKCIYLACGDGVISIVRQTDADHYERLSDVPTVEDARNSLFVAETSTFYLTVPRSKGAMPQLHAYRAGRGR